MIAKGVPLGKKSPKNFILCFFTPRKLMEKKIEKDNANVINIWLVTVNPKGIRPIKLEIDKKEAKLKMTGK